MANNKTKYTEEQIETAKAMYMDNIPVVEIASEMHMKRSSIQYYVRKGWQRERDLKNSRMLKDVSRGILEDISEGQGAGLKILNRGLNSLLTRPKPPTTQELTHVAKIMETMHKIATQEDSKANQPVDLNPEEAMQEINNDPFLGGSSENN